MVSRDQEAGFDFKLQEILIKYVNFAVLISASNNSSLRKPNLVSRRKSPENCLLLPEKIVLYKHNEPEMRNGNEDPTTLGIDVVT